MRSLGRLLRRALRAGFAVAALWLAAPGDSSAQSCSTVSGTYTCTVAAGTYSSEVNISVPTSDLNVPPVSVTSLGTVNLTLTGQSNPTALDILGLADGGSSGSINGGDAQGMTITNSGALTLTASGSQSTNFVYGLF